MTTRDEIDTTAVRLRWAPMPDTNGKHELLGLLDEIDRTRVELALAEEVKQDYMTRSEGWSEQAAAAESKLRSVLSLHSDGDGWCEGCDYGWPCPTIKAVEEASNG